MSVTITNLELNPGEILESVCKRPAARTAAYGTGLIRVDVTSPCSLYIRGEDGFRLVISDAESRSDDEWVSEFLHEGMTASYHYADDSGKEWSLGAFHQDRAIALWKAHPELTPRFLEVGKKFLWSFSNIVQMEEKTPAGGVMKTLEEIALDIARNIPVTSSPGFKHFVSPDFVKRFAKAFLAAVDSERGEPVAWTVSGLITDFSRDFSAYQTKTYTRPLYLHPQPTPQEVEDARRYRALAANLSSTEFCEHLWTSCNDVPTKEQLDAAIDAAIAKEES